MHRFRELSLVSKISFFAVLLLLGGLFFAVDYSQQQQNTRTRAAENIVVNNQRIDGDVNGNLIGSDNIVDGDISGDVVGNKNKIDGDIDGCLRGDNNRVDGDIRGTVTGIDNKIDGDIDNDPSACKIGGPTSPPVEKPRCSDNIDNDNNGVKDDKDSSCHTDGDPNNPDSYDPNIEGEQPGNGTCSDGIDNDNDGKIDGKDPDCHVDGDPSKPYDPTLDEGPRVSPSPSLSPSPSASPSPSLSPSPTSPPSRCSDNIDNDNNGVKDDKDSSCHTDGDPNNPDSYDPNIEGEQPGNGTCSDGIDNDNDGKIDGKDPDCHVDGDPSKPYDPTLDEGPTGDKCWELGTCTALSFDLKLHGIGKGGDNANPNANGNPNPLRSVRAVEVIVANNQNQTVDTATGSVTFASASGTFRGIVKLNANIASGLYSIRIKSNQFLRTLVIGPAINLVENTLNEMPVTALVNGDIDNNNSVNILDYNLLMGCYSDLLPAASCSPEQKLATDLDDDGKVNQFDYNLFLRELVNLPGQ